MFASVSHSRSYPYLRVISQSNTQDPVSPVQGFLQHAWDLLGQLLMIFLTCPSVVTSAAYGVAGRPASNRGLESPVGSSAPTACRPVPLKRGQSRIS